MTNYAKKTLYGTFFILLLSFFAAVAGYFVRMVLARGLSPEDYGLFYAVFAFFGLLVIFKDFGMNQALVKFVSDYMHKKDQSGVKSIIISVFLIQILLSALICVIMILSSGYLSIHLFQTPSAYAIIIMLSFMFVLMPLENIITYSFQAAQRMFYFSSISAVRMIFILIFSLIFLSKGMGAAAPAFAYLLAYLVVPVIYFPFFLKVFPYFFRAEFNMPLKKIKQLLRFGITLLVGVFGGVIMLNIDTVILSYFSGAREVALYQVASPTARMVLYFGYAVAAVFLPLAAELWAKKKKEKLKTSIELIYRYSFIIVMPCALLLLVFPELILTILFTSEYAGAAPVMQILAVGAIFYTVGHINCNVLTGIGKPESTAKIVIYAAVFNLLANIILIPMLGTIGAAISTLVAWLFILGMTSLDVKKNIMTSVPWFGWLKNLIAGSVFVLVISFLKEYLMINLYAEIFISVGAASIVYFLLIIFFRLITKEDLNLLMYALGRKPFFNKQGQDKV